MPFSVKTASRNCGIYRNDQESWGEDGCGGGCPPKLSTGALQGLVSDRSGLARSNRAFSLGRWTLRGRSIVNIAWTLIQRFTIVEQWKTKLCESGIIGLRMGWLELVECQSKRPQEVVDKRCGSGNKNCGCRPNVSKFASERWIRIWHGRVRICNLPRGQGEGVDASGHRGRSALVLAVSATLSPCTQNLPAHTLGMRPLNPKALWYYMAISIVLNHCLTIFFNIRVAKSFSHFLSIGASFYSRIPVLRIWCLTLTIDQGVVDSRTDEGLGIEKP